MDRKRQRSIVSKTQQSMESKTNIRNIVQQYKKTGIMPPPQQLMYGDFSYVPDIHEIFATIEKAKSAFMALPAKIRKQFNNQPEDFIRYMEDPEMFDEQVKAGLREKPQEITDEPQRVVIVNDEKTKGADAT